MRALTVCVHRCVRKGDKAYDSYPCMSFFTNPLVHLLFSLVLLIIEEVTCEISSQCHDFGDHDLDVLPSVAFLYFWT